jgi:hypothetical protein
MHSAQHAYKRSTTTQWSRIDLLVALYAATLKSLQSGAVAIRQKNQAEADRLLILAQRQLLALLEGIKPGPDGGADGVKRVLIFAISCLGQRSEMAWDDAHRVVSTLHSAFVEIQDEARALEASGEIPSHDLTSQSQYVA